MITVGLSGVAGVGKDVGAQGLVRELGFTRIAFADTLREAIYRLNPIVDPMDGFGCHRVKEIVDELGWDKAKRDYTEIRELLQRMGTEVGRQLIDDQVWIDVVFNRAEREGIERLVIPDVRFPNELLAITKHRGKCFRVIRPGFAPINAHASDNALSDEDFAPQETIHNDCDELEYQRRVVVAAASWMIDL